VIKSLLAVALLISVPGCASVASEPDPLAAEAARNLELSERFLSSNRIKDGVVQTASGLQYKPLVSGSGCRPLPGSSVRLHYTMHLLGNEKVLDETYSIGEAASFDLRAMIPAWEEGIPLMRQGDTWEMYVPPSLGYGEKGSPPYIPPNTVVIFRLELVDVPRCSGA